MKYITKEFVNTDYIYLLPIGDMHIGDPHFNLKKFCDLRDWIIQQPNTYIVMPGDILNCATKNSKSDVYQDMNPTEARNLAVELLLPIKDRILGMTWGNHERRIYNESGFDICESLADKLQVPYAREGMLLNLKFKPWETKGKINYSIYITHGMGGGKTKGAKVNVVNNLASIILADCYICGHIHFMSTFKDSYFVPDLRAEKINKVTRTFVSAGSFLGYGGYSEDLCLPPAKLGTPRIRFNATKKDLHVSI